MLINLPEELREIIISYLTRKEYKDTVPCKALLLCKSYLSLEDYCKLTVIPKILLSDKEREVLLLTSCKNNNLFLLRWSLKKGVDPSIWCNLAIRYASQKGHKGWAQV